MKSVIVKCGLGLAVVILAGLFLFLYRFQSYQVQKLEFIIHDYATENYAEQDEEDFLRYLSACDATYEVDDRTITVEYRGIYADKTWTVPRREH